MRHYVAYHNIERMGRPLHDSEPFQLLTDKPVQPLRSNTVWFIVGEGIAPKQYSLGSVFRVDEVGDLTDGDFKHYARGSDHLFQPPVGLNDLEWFPGLLKSLANFSLGVQEIKDPGLIDSLVELASKSGSRFD